MAPALLWAPTVLGSALLLGAGVVATDASGVAGSDPVERATGDGFDADRVADAAADAR